ncbi:MAG: hypothetical protein KAR83_01215 [Thermodesulfovibrionales bacterium]|nr:hypothetical protein [Thermodesulfovibrionales bacterium]
MNNNEHLALFVLGVGTIGVTFLLLFAFSDRNTGSIPVLDKQIQILAAQAAAVPQPQPQAPAPAPAPASMDALDREVAETFRKTAAYLGRSTFEEKEHVALLERLEFYSGLSSIKPEHKKTAQDLIKDMTLLLTLKASVARQVKLSGQINAAVTDAQTHLAEGKKNEAVARKIMDRIEGLYVIQGLSADQNRKLQASLSALKRAYKAPASSRQADIPKALTPYVNKTKKDAAVIKPPATKIVTPKVQVSKVEPKTASKPVPKAPVVTVAPPKAKPVPKAPVVVTAPEKSKKPDSQITREFHKTMTKVSYYMQVGKYDKPQNDKLLDELHRLLRSSGSLSEHDRGRLKQAIMNMERVNMAKGFRGSWGSGK